MLAISSYTQTLLTSCRRSRTLQPLTEPRHSASTSIRVASKHPHVYVYEQLSSINHHHRNRPNGLVVNTRKPPGLTTRRITNSQPSERAMHLSISGPCCFPQQLGSAWNANRSKPSPEGPPPPQRQTLSIPHDIGRLTAEDDLPSGRR